MSSEYHPLATIVPAMSSGEFVELKRDIERNGMHDPIWVLDGKILDGRHRAKACAELGIAIETREYTGTDPVGFVLSMNLHRRHLNAKQKRKLVKDLLKADPAQSDRSIAAKTGVSPTTVAAARKDSNVQSGHTAERKETSGRKARGRKPKSPVALATVSKAKDLDAARIIKELSGIQQSDLSNPQEFSAALFHQAHRLSPVGFSVSRKNK